MESQRWGALPVTALRLPAAELRVLGSLAARARRDGTVTGHGQGGIAADTGLNERTIRRALQRLAQWGWLTTTPGDGRVRSFHTLHRHPLARSADTQTPRGRVPRPPQPEIPDNPPGGERVSAPLPGGDTQEDVMARRDENPDQLGMDLELPETPAPVPKPRKDGGPASRVVAAYCAAYSETFHRQPSSERGRVAGQVRALLTQGHAEEELIQAADQLGRTRFTYLAESVRQVRAARETRERVQAGAVVENYGGADATDARDQVYG